ncbi:MAG: DUF4011 domain-containing protein [Candidatus Caenarcaniphilales bacterium]|nr:DUF4011 domain-containing protein [Candidatus Caenarcaniphilales bacterium]
MSLLEHWKNNLIDTSGRNSLLYFKFVTQKGEPKKNFLNLINFDDDLLNKLFNGQAISLSDEAIETQLERQKSDNTRTQDSSNAEYRKLAKTYHPDNRETGDEEKFKQLQASFKTIKDTEEQKLPKDPLAERKKVLDTLRLKDKTAEEDLGTNILYLSYGFLHWSEPKKDGAVNGLQNNVSPLFIIPLDIIKLGGLSPRYSITIDDDEAIVFNPALRVYLKQSFGMNFDSIPEKIDEDEINVNSFQSYFEIIKQTVSKNSWTIDKSKKTVSAFGFANLSMYKEIEEWQEIMLDHPLISTLTNKVILRTLSKTL